MPGKIILFEEDSRVRNFMKCAVEKIHYVRGNEIRVIADSEPWSAKDRVDLGTLLVITGSSNRSPEWDALSYAKDVTTNVPVIAGRNVWDYESRRLFAQSGAIFTYDVPFRYKKFEAMITAAIKYGSFMRTNCAEKGSLVAIHLPFGGEDFVIEKF